MNTRLTVGLLLGVFSIQVTAVLTHAADSPSPAEKSKLIEPAAKPAIAKPSDALVSKSKGGMQAEVKQVEAKITDAKENISQTPAGRPINDLKVTTGALTAPKPGSMPRAGVTPAAEGQSPAADPLEEKVRVLLQDKLGKDGEVVLRVSPDTPAGKLETNGAAKGRLGPTKASENSKLADNGVGDATRQSGDTTKLVLMGGAKVNSENSERGSDTSNRSAEPNSSRSSQHLPWDWSGQRGPQAWGRLDPSYANCSNGRMQSPPSIAEFQFITSSGPLLPTLDWQMQGFNWSRQGPLWTVNLFEANSWSTFRGESFALDSIQFRFPGEPFVGIEPPVGSIHLIHRLGNRFLIIAVPIEIDDKSARNLTISTLLKRFPMDASENLSWSGLQIDPQSLIPNPMKSAVWFPGSLSHPPCSESVIWLVTNSPISLPKSQWTELSKLLGVGGRPLQPLYGRPVLSIGS